MNDRILIDQLEVHYRVGVPDEERAQPQRLLLCLELEADFKQAVQTDDLSHTVNYEAVCRRLKDFGEERSWKLIETLAADLATMILQEFHVQSVQIEVRKFVIPETNYIAVRHSMSLDI